MRHLFTLASLTLFGATLISSSANAEEVLLEDYQYGGKFEAADWYNTFADPNGRENDVNTDGVFAVVNWATKWSGAPSTGEVMDLSKFKTYQVDVRVEKGQPTEEGANFYAQLLTQADEGYAYWEVFAPQEKVPADGKWYRLQIPIKNMVAAAGDGADAPTDFTNVNGCCVGMTFDEEGDRFKFKTCAFDNVILLTDEIDEIKVAPSPKTVNPPKK